MVLMGAYIVEPYPIIETDVFISATVLLAASLGMRGRGAGNIWAGMCR